MQNKQLTNLIYWTLFAAIIFYLAYSKGWILAPFESITPRQADELLRHDGNVTLLDVRTPEEFSQMRIEGAVLMPVQALQENILKLEHLKGKKVIVYCRSGSRSVTASRILTENGFVVLNMRGGITEWRDEGYGVTR